jgi:hypothetical protein
MKKWRDPRPEQLFLELTRALVRGSADEAERIARQTDFSRFVWLAAGERLAGFLYGAIRRSGISSSFPEATVARLRSSYVRQWADNQCRLREAARLSRSLRETAPDLVFLKGPILADRLYGDLGMRAIVDVDLLVRWRDVGRVEAVLFADGYRRRSKQTIFRGLAHVFAHDFAYEREGFAVEVHWALQRHPGLKLDHDAVRGRATMFEVEGLTLRAAATTDELVLQILSAFTDLQLGEAKLRTFVDQYALLAALGERFDWSGFLAARAAEGLGGITIGMLALLFDLFDCREDFPSLAALVAERRPNLGVLRRADGLAALRTSPRIMRQRIEWLKLCDSSLPLALLWWALSLPTRLTVHRRRPARAAAIVQPTALEPPPRGVADESRIPARVTIPAAVRFLELEEDGVLLDLRNDRSYGLDDVGARMWRLLIEHHEVEAAVKALGKEYPEVSEATLRDDLVELIRRVADAGLVSTEP